MRKPLPWWLLAAGLLAVLGAWSITTQAGYRQILATVASGLGVTLWVTLVAFTFAILLGLGLGLMRVSSVRLLREVATFYVEIVRGIPMLVILYYIAFVGAPGLVEVFQWMGIPIGLRDLDFTARAILALTLGYAAFLAEIFRAGIESIHRGQLEAALALGHSRIGALAHVVALITGRRWKLGSLEYPAADSPDRRRMILDLDSGGRGAQVETQLAKLYDVLSVRRREGSVSSP